MLSVHSGNDVMPLALARYCFLGGLFQGSFEDRGWSTGRVMRQAPAWRATYLIRVRGVGRPASVQRPEISDFFQPPVMTWAATRREIGMGAISSSLIWAFMYTSRP